MDLVTGAKRVVVADGSCNDPSRCFQRSGIWRKAYALGAEVVTLMRYKDSPEPPPPVTVPAGYEDKTMHATFRIGGTTLMASDGSGDTPSFAGFSLSLAVPTAAEADRAFAALGDGGDVMMPLDKTFWSPRFGMLTDRFGLGWMVSVTA
jgi:PhnB protein